VDDRAGLGIELKDVPVGGRIEPLALQHNHVRRPIRRARQVGTPGNSQVIQLEGDDPPVRAAVQFFPVGGKSNFAFPRRFVVRLAVKDVCRLEYRAGPEVDLVDIAIDAGVNIFQGEDARHLGVIAVRRFAPIEGEIRQLDGANPAVRSKIQRVWVKRSQADFRFAGLTVRRNVIDRERVQDLARRRVELVNRTVRGCEQQ